MATQKPLAMLIPSILQHIRKHEETLQYNLRLYRVFEGQIKREIEDSMRKEILSPPALKRALQRVPSVNILKKTVDKLSKVYAEPVTRLTTNKDQEIMDSIIKISGFNATMMAANKMLNLTKMAAIEPFVQDGKQKFRVLAGHQFLPYSDDPVNPLNMTVFIKLLGHKSKSKGDNRTYIEEDGLLVTDDDEIRQVDVFQLFSDNEILIIDSDGSIRKDLMTEMGISPKNELEEIPQIYLNKSSHELVPFPDTADLDVSILVPKLLSDLNYAAQFMSHSIIWTKNADLGNQEVNPDAIVDLGDSNPNGGGEPEMGTIDPKVDIAGVLQMIEFELATYFSGKGIKTASMKGMLPGREASGIAKAMDEGDTSAELKAQQEYFRMIEQQFWGKMQTLQNFWSNNNMVKENRLFSTAFAVNFSIIFKDLKIVESTQEKVMKIQAQRDLGVIDRRSIIKEFNPDMSEEQIEERLAQVDKEKMDAINMMESFGGFNGDTAEGNNQNSEEVRSERASSNSESNNQQN